MDAVVTNYVSLKHKAFVVAGGSFGYRWKSLCDYYDIDVDLYEVPFAKDIDYSDLEAKIALSHPDVFLCQQHETSTGQMFNLDKISYICKNIMSLWSLMQSVLFWLILCICLIWE